MLFFHQHAKHDIMIIVKHEKTDDVATNRTTIYSNVRHGKYVDV